MVALSLFLFHMPCNFLITKDSFLINRDNLSVSISIPVSTAVGVWIYSNLARS